MSFTTAAQPGDYNLAALAGITDATFLLLPQLPQFVGDSGAETAAGLATIGNAFAVAHPQVQFVPAPWHVRWAETVQTGEENMSLTQAQIDELNRGDLNTLPEMFQTIGLGTRLAAAEDLNAAPGGIATEDLADGAVTTAKIADGAVGTTELAAGAVTAAKIGSNISSITFDQSAYSTADATVPAATASALTDNSGGASPDGTIGVVTAPSALTDSTGGAASTTLAAVTAPNALTDNSGGSASTTIAAISDTATKNAIASLVHEEATTRAAITALTNMGASLAARQAEDRTAIVALTDAVKELSTMINHLVADSLQNRKLINKLIDSLQAANIAG